MSTKKRRVVTGKTKEPKKIPMNLYVMDEQEALIYLLKTRQPRKRK